MTDDQRQRERDLAARHREREERERAAHEAREEEIKEILKRTRSRERRDDDLGSDQSDEQ